MKRVLISLHLCVLITSSHIKGRGYFYFETEFLVPLANPVSHEDAEGTRHLRQIYSYAKNKFKLEVVFLVLCCFPEFYHFIILTI